MKTQLAGLILLSAVFLSCPAKSEVLNCQTTDIQDDPSYGLTYDAKYEAFTSIGYGVCIEGHSCTNHFASGEEEIQRSPYAKFPLGKIVVPKKGLIFSLEKFAGKDNKCIIGELIMLDPNLLPTFAKIECRAPSVKPSECRTTFENELK